MESKAKLTFKELLEKHEISFEQFYLQAAGISMCEIEVLYNLNIGVFQAIKDILTVLNEVTGELYTIDDISTRHIYGHIPTPIIPEERI